MSGKSGSSPTFPIKSKNSTNPAHSLHSSTHADNGASTNTSAACASRCSARSEYVM